MSEEIVGAERLNVTLDRMIEALKPSGRKRLLNAVVRKVAAANRARIGQNVTPEGAPMEPRIARPGGKSRKKPRRMFLKLKSAGRLRFKTWPERARVFFTDQKIASVHHYGLRDRIDRKLNRMVQYPARPLLGVSEADKDMVEATLLDHFVEAL